MPSKSSSAESGNGQQIAATAAVAGSTAAREFHNFVGDIEELFSSMTSLTGDELARARAKVGERVTAARASVEELGGAIAGQTRAAVKSTDQYVHREPWQAIGIGVGVGFLLGLVLARRG